MFNLLNFQIEYNVTRVNVICFSYIVQIFVNFFLLCKFNYSIGKRYSIYFIFIVFFFLRKYVATLYKTLNLGNHLKYNFYFNGYYCELTRPLHVDLVQWVVGPHVLLVEEKWLVRLFFWMSLMLLLVFYFKMWTFGVLEYWASLWTVLAFPPYRYVESWS